MPKNGLIKEVKESVAGMSYQYYAVNTQKPCILYIHGIAANKNIMYRECYNPDSQFGAYILDLPGHNDIPIYGDGSLSDFSNYLLVFLENHPNVAGLLGFSFGGLLAMELSSILSDIGKNIPTVIWSTPIFTGKSGVTPFARTWIETGTYLPDYWYIRLCSSSYVTKISQKMHITLYPEDIRSLLAFKREILKKIKPIFTHEYHIPDSVPYLFIYDSKDKFISTHPYQNLNLTNNTIQQKLMIDGAGHFANSQGRHLAYAAADKFFAQYITE